MSRNISVAVWGNRGAGKGTFAAALADALSKRFHSILLVNADCFQPAFSMWGVAPDEDLAEKEGRKIESIAQTLSCPNLTDEYLRHRLQYLPSNKNIALMGYLTEDDYEKYSPILGNDAQTMLHEAKKLFQVVLIDCTNPQQDKVTEKALQNADIVVMLLEPNCLGVGFLRAQSSFIRGCLSDTRPVLFLAAKVDERSAVDEFERRLGVRLEKKRLTYTDQARAKLYASDLFSAYQGEYGEAVSALCERIIQEVKE